MSTDDAVDPSNRSTASMANTDGHPPAFVLCLDDDEAILEMLEAFLSRDGSVEVLTTTDPTQAIQLVSHGIVDLVVSDYEMDGISGLEFLDRIRGHSSDVPFMLFTSHGMTELTKDERAADVAQFFQKGDSDGLVRLVDCISDTVDAYNNS